MQAFEKLLFRLQTVRRGTAAPYLLLAPALLAAAVLVLLPALRDGVAVAASGACCSGRARGPSSGSTNYVRALADSQFWQSLWHSLIWVVASVGLQFLLGLGAALLLNRHFAWRGIARALVVVPWALPSVIIGLVWTWMLDFNLGAHQPARPEARPARRRPCPSCRSPGPRWPRSFSLWSGRGSRSSPSRFWRDCRPYRPSSTRRLRSTAPGNWAAFRHVTWPGLAPVIATALLLRMIWVANSLDLILVMTGGGPGTSTETLPLYAFLTAWSGMDYGRGSALAVMLTVILLGVVVASLLRARNSS